MALILGMLGGAAVVEIHRAITGNGNNNKDGVAVLNQKKKQQEMLSVIDGLKTREKELQQAIRDLEGEIEGYANSNELSEAERRRLERVCSQLREQLAEAETKHRDLSKRYQDLEEDTKKIQEREHVLEGCVESLKAENSMLISQFERLKMKHEEETALFEMQLKTLQENVSNILMRYVENAITVQVMGEELNQLGVEFACTSEVMAKASTKRERREAVGQLQLQVDQNSFFNQIHLTSSPTRAAQLFFSSSNAGRQDDSTQEVGPLPSKAESTENDVENDTIAALHSPETKQKKGFFGRSSKAANTKQTLVPLVLYARLKRAGQGRHVRGILQSSKDRRDRVDEELRDIMSLRYSILDILQKVFLSERVAWATQNAVGAVFPILFVVVNKLRFSGSCTAILFYGVSSQAFSVDRSIGGRVFGAILWTGGYLFGGLLGYLITSLAWLARGDAEGILTYEYTGGTLTEEEGDVVKSYLSDGSSADLLDANISTGLVQSLVEFNSNTVSHAYYILLIVLHIVCSIYLTRCRTMESDFMSMARGTVSHIFLSVMSTLAILLPLLGQHKYWADVISANLKGVTITMFGAIAGPLLVYVQSSHDNLRRDIGHVMINAGKFLTAKTSLMHHCLTNQGTEMSAVTQKIVENMSGISSVQELIKDTLKAEGDAVCCYLEPTWPLFASQVGMDIRLYKQLLSSLQRLLGTVNAMTSISIENFDDLSEEDVRIVSVIEQCAVGVSTALQDVAVCLHHMPLWGHCSGNSLHWRPKGSAYWNTYLDLVQDIIQESLPYLRESACQGIAASFDANSRHEQGLTQLYITQLVSSEILIEECIVLEHLAAKALDITDIAYQDMMAGVEAQVDHEQKHPGSFPRRCVGAIYRNWENICQNVYFFALSNDLKQGTSYFTYKLQISRFVETNLALVRGAWLDMNVLKTLFHRRDFQFYLKFFIAINSGFVAIILILWLGYGNTDSSIRNATSMAKWFGDWKPEYFLTASVICLQMQVEISVVKAILRTSLIALGGVLGYVTLLNGTLAQNPYFILFMGVLINGFFGLFSIYGMDFRYSLFLAVYTWNGIVMCHYTGVCCSSGTVLDFGGKAVSTCFGALWALIFSILIKPLYTSEVVFSLEKEFLGRVMEHVEKSFHKGGALLSSFDDGREIEEKGICSGGVFERKIIRAQQYPQQLEELRSAVNGITQLRISTYQAYGKQITTNSLDKREVVFIKLNLIPLPASIHLVMSHLSPLGAWTSGSLKMLYNYNLGQRGGAVSKYFLQNMMEPTDSVLVASKVLVRSISRFLERRSNVKVEEIRQDILEDVAALETSRKRLRQTFMNSVQAEIISMKECTIGDIKCLTWYVLLMWAMGELECMGNKIAKDDRYIERDDYTSFFISWYTRR